MFWQKLWALVRGLFVNVLMGMILTTAILQAAVLIEDHGIRKIERQQRVERDRIRALPFEAIVKYYAIIPPEKTVGYSSESRFISDNEVLEAIEDIQGGVKLDWFEDVRCDHTPHDNSIYYEYYREAQSSGAAYDKPRARRDISKLRGFPVLAKNRYGPNGERRAIRYPDHDADCVLRSLMIMTLPDGSLKSFEKISEPVFVRGA